MSTTSRPRSAQRPPFQAVYYPPWLVAYYLDALTAFIPQTRDSPVQVGLEPIIAAFIPLAGPVLAALFGFYIIFLSLMFGITWYDVARMVINICIDMGAGFVPILGTMIDVAFKANLANLAILEAHMRRTPKYAYLNLPPPRTWLQSLFGRGTSNW